MRIALRLILGLVVLCGILWLVGPYEPANISARFDPAAMQDDIDAHFAQSEAAFDDITPGTEKRVVWAGAPGETTPLSVLYVHGFSATSEEIRPVPDRIAEALGANLVYTRLKGHGRSGDAMAEATVADWMVDLTEALEAAKRTGERVLVISTSTGGTLVTAAAVDAELMENVAGLIFVAPNFGLNSPVAALIGWPAARYWLPVLAGQRRSFEPANEAHGRYWTTEYPSVAVMPMDAAIRAVVSLDLSAVKVPALFHYSPDDQVVNPQVTAEIVKRWGGPTKTSAPTLTEQDDPLAHVIAGDVMSPSQTEATVALMLDWIESLP